jgi:hypothetical protein
MKKESLVKKEPRMDTNEHEFADTISVHSCSFVVQSLGLPSSTLYNKRIPKQKFYENITVSVALKRVFIEQISQITWRNKIAPSTVNVAEGEVVKEIEVFTIRLNQRSLDTKVFVQIDKEIPYHILFLLEYKDEEQAWIGYKEQSQTKSGTFKPGIYYHTDWTGAGSLTLKLDGLNMDTVYESLIRQVAGGRLSPDSASEEFDIKEAVSRDEQRQRLQREIAALENRVRREKQFNRQVELNGELKKLKEELCQL